MSDDIAETSRLLIFMIRVFRQLCVNTFTVKLMYARKIQQRIPSLQVLSSVSRHGSSMNTLYKGVVLLLSPCQSRFKGIIKY